MNKIYWKAEEFKYKEKGADWYWILWSLSILFASASYYFLNDYIFSTLLIMVAVIITIASFKKPEIKKYSLDKENIYLEDDKKEIPFSEIKSYNIDPENMKILINTKNKFEPLIQIPFEASQNILKIDKFLSTKIKKDDQLKIPILELILNKLLGF